MVVVVGKQALVCKQHPCEEVLMLTSVLFWFGRKSRLERRRRQTWKDKDISQWSFEKAQVR